MDPRPAVTVLLTTEQIIVSARRRWRPAGPRDCSVPPTLPRVPPRAGARSTPGGGSGQGASRAARPGGGGAQTWLGGGRAQERTHIPAPG